MNRIRRYPSPSLAVSITALVISLGGAGYSATGGNFILGQANSASTQTKLVTPLNGAAFRVDNTSTAAAATGVTIVTNAARPPLTVSSSTKVANLNVDKFDGLDSTSFTRTNVIPFNLAAGASTAPITLPSNRPVFLMGVTLTLDFRGVGQATLLRIPGDFIAWTGLNSPTGSTITSGVSGTTGEPIVSIDGGLEVDIEVSGPDAIRVHNNYSNRSMAGVITLMW